MMIEGTRVDPCKTTGLLSCMGMAALLAGCAGGPAPALRPAGELAAACGTFQGRAIEPRQIGLPSGDAKVESAQWVPAQPAYCRLLGAIGPLDPKAPRIHFQLNLPANWNGKALQYGGGGFNGVLITGLAPLRDAPNGAPTPLAQGYATFGTDSGHQSSAYPPTEVAAWALNEEARTNFAYASYKKVKDVAHQLAADFYGNRPAKSYFFGGSEGGREGLTMAQRFPADYDGIVSVVPVINYVGLNHSFLRAQRMQMAGGWLPPKKLKALAEGVAKACDALDGLEDGVVSNYLACPAKFDPAALRCPMGGDTGDACLSDRQVEVVRATYSDYLLVEPMVNGITGYPARLPGGEDVPGAGWDVWVAGKAAPTLPVNTEASRQWLYGGNFIRYFIAQDANFDLAAYDPARFRARLQEVSRLMDSTDPDLSAFFARGGKLILRENASDLAQSAQVGMEYYKSVLARFGQPKTDEHVRLYVSPASTHTGNARSSRDGAEVPTAFDMLEVLDRWAGRGEPPADALTQVLDATAPPHRVLATRPLCRFPGYPHYTGGDRLKAESYACRESQPKTPIRD
jgi:feruloyl esterase